MNCDFSLAHYKEILETALSNGYSFLSYDEDLTPYKDKRVCVLRHDIDYTPERAVIFGEIEAELGIQSTYFFLKSKQQIRTISLTARFSSFSSNKGLDQL